MNSIVLMASVMAEPELRYTPENLAIASLLVSFPSSRPEDPPFQVRVAAFGDLAQTVIDHCHVGDQLVVEGQLHINTVERDGKNEKRAEVNARRVYQVGAGSLQMLSGASEFEATAKPVASTPAPAPAPAPARSSAPEPAPQPTRTPVARKPARTEPDLDDIPF
jgi:single-stranded DNA-binding protein